MDGRKREPDRGRDIFHPCGEEDASPVPSDVHVARQVSGRQHTPHAASAIGFTAHHVIALAAQFNWIVTVFASMGVFIGGATWSWLYKRYRSVWPGYVSHAIADIPIFVIGWQLIFGVS